MSEFWHKMSCCVVTKPPPKKKRRKIDRSMIGEPMNFVHLTHIGSGEMAEGMPPVRAAANHWTTCATEVTIWVSHNTELLDVHGMHGHRF
uniref:CDC42 small effector 1 n=1 Tax=Paramormyrops kingsleyae TaxID=1676925 RepID=A0A3B3SHM0_9TELE